MTEITCYKLDAAFALLQEFDHFAKPEDFIEVSLWHNGEGFSAYLNSNGEECFDLTWGQFKALKKLVKQLKFSDSSHQPIPVEQSPSKSPSLKKQALGAVGRFTVNAHTNATEMMQDFDTIRRALEQLDD